MKLDLSPPLGLPKVGVSLPTRALGSALGFMFSTCALAQSYPSYDENTTYAGGDIVSNAGATYICNEGVTVAWCSGAAWAYEPGLGVAWQQAWSLLGSESSASEDSSTSTADSNEPDEDAESSNTESQSAQNTDSDLPSMSADSWSASSVYVGGDTVESDGMVWEAQWWTQGDEPGALEWGPWKEVGVASASSSSGDSGESSDSDGNQDDEDLFNFDDSDGEGETAAEDSDYPAYQEGEFYVGGSIVSNAGANYRCIEGPTEAWCGSVAWAYAPGEGTAWQDAWSLYTGDSGGDGSGSGEASGDTPSADAEVVALSTILFDEELLTSSEAFQQVAAATRTIDNDVVEQVSPGLPSNPSNVQRVEALMSGEDFEFLFPERAPEYDYRKFLQAVAKFPAYCGDYDDGRDAEQICRVSLATTFAHFAQETGGHADWWDVPEWRQALVHVREMGWNEGDRGGYNGECNPDVWQGQTWPCGTYEDGEFKSYFGRGAKQLSYNYNYGPFSEAMFGDVRVLLDSPELVADTWLNFASAIFFFVYPQPPKPSMLHVIDGTWEPNASDIANGLVPGFGVTVNIINGGVECGGSSEMAQVVNRIEYYLEFANFFDVPVPDDEVLGCAGMKQFDANGSAAGLGLNWEEDWSYPNRCQLVGYQTAYDALREGDYRRCVENFFDVYIDETM